MSKTKVTNKEIAEAFKIARERIANHTHTYICNALEYPTIGLNGVEALYIIQDRLNGIYTYEEWVSVYYPDLYIKMETTDSSYEQGRLQWLDSLIEEFSNKPDEGELKNV